MTKEMKTFLIEFTNLLEKHGVELDAVEETSGYSNYVDGIDCTMEGKYKDNVCIKEYCDIRLPVNVSAQDLYDLVKTAKVD